MIVKYFLSLKQIIVIETQIDREEDKYLRIAME